MTGGVWISRDTWIRTDYSWAPKPVRRPRRPPATVTAADGSVWVVPSDAAVADGRFLPGGPTGYRSSRGGPVRATRVEAVADWAARLDAASGVR